MNKILSLTFAFTITMSIAIAQNTTFPDATLKGLDNKNVTLSEVFATNKYTFVSFWATWCAPCKRELDAMSELYPELKAAHGLQVVAITIDDIRGQSQIPAMVKSKGWEYLVLGDPNGTLQQSLNFPSIPQSYLVDQNGKIIYSHTGYKPGDEFELQDVLVKLK